MNPNFINDLEVVDDATVESLGPAYPVAQWLNGDPKLAAAGGVAHTGGVILPLKYVGDQVTPPQGWQKTTVAFSTGKTETVLATQKVWLAVIRTRFRWFVTDNGVTMYYPRNSYMADMGMRGHLQALCGIAGFDFPIVVTFKGKASQEFERLLKAFTQTVYEASQQFVRESPNGGQPTRLHSRFPRFAFYMPLTAGPHMKAGQKGQDALITPPVLELPAYPAQITREYLNQIYVGRERLVAFQQIYHDAAEWVAGWDKPVAETLATDEEDAKF